MFPAGTVTYVLPFRSSCAERPNSIPPSQSNSKITSYVDGSITDTLVEEYGVDYCTEGIRNKTPFMDKLFYSAVSVDVLEKAAQQAELSYKVTEEGKITFVLDHTTDVLPGSVQSVILEITDAQGSKKSNNMVLYQPDSDDETYYCYLKTDYTEADLNGMKAEAYFSVKNVDRYLMATWSN